MFRSIRWTLQLWHAGLLAVVLLAFGAVTFLEIRRSRFAQIDAELERTVQLIAAGVRPPFRFEGPGGPFDRGQPPEARRPQLRLSPALQDRFEKPTDGAYYIVWGRFGEVLGSAGNVADVPRPAVEQQEGPGFGPPPGDRRDNFGPNDGRDYRPGMDGPPPREPGGRPDEQRPNDPRPGEQGMPPTPPAPQPPTLRQRDNLREAVVVGPFGTVAVFGVSVAGERDELRRLGLLMFSTGAAVLAVGLMGGLLLASRVIRPIKTITNAAKSISVKNLSSRIDVADTESELGQLAEVLNTTFSRLDGAFRQQVRFTADASHELRTPLAVIHTATQLALSRDRSAEEYKKTIQTCHRATIRMKDLVDSLLLLAGADAGRLTLEKKPVDLADVARNSAEMLVPLATEKGVRMEIKALPATVSADAMRLDQVVTNLVSNAIRYNKPGGRIDVVVATEERDAVLKVTDTGIGIPADHQPHLFERFYRVDAARSRAEGGSGLGLAISRSIVMAHGGTISFESESDEGTTFIVRLPLVSQPAVSEKSSPQVP